MSTVQVKNRFTILLQELEEEESDAIANRVRDVWITAADKYFRRTNMKRQHWISDQTLEKIEERRKLKAN